MASEGIRSLCLPAVEGALEVGVIRIALRAITWKLRLVTRLDPFASVGATRT